MDFSVLVEVYRYPDDSNTNVIIDGKTSASDIPLPGITSTTIQVLVATVTNRAVNLSSEKFNSTECSTELNSSTSITTTTATTTTTVTSAIPTVTGMCMGTCIHIHNNITHTNFISYHKCYIEYYHNR